MEDGFAAASMSSIASRVGGSKGTLYNYFPSKQQLFEAMIRNECDLKQAAMFDSLQVGGRGRRDGAARGRAALHASWC